MTPRRFDGVPSGSGRRALVHGFHRQRAVVALHSALSHAVDPITRAVSEGSGLPLHAVLLPVPTTERRTEARPHGDGPAVSFTVALANGGTAELELRVDPVQLHVGGRWYVPGGNEEVPPDLQRALAEAVNGRSSFGRLVESQYDAIVTSLLKFALPQSSDPGQELAALGRLHAMLDPETLRHGVEQALPHSALVKLAALHRWGFYPYSVNLGRADPGRTLARLPPPDFDAVIAQGLTQDGQHFLANAELAGMPPVGLDGSGELRVSDGGVHWIEGVPSVEQRLLSDPATVTRLQERLLTALATNGPLTDRQLVRATGISQACVIPLLSGAQGLLNLYRGAVVRRFDGTLALCRAEDRWRRREALLKETRGAVYHAFQEAVLLRPALKNAKILYLSGADPRDPDDLATASEESFLELKRLELLPSDATYGEWRVLQEILGRDLSDDRRFRAYWGELGLRCVERVLAALHRAIGAHQTAWYLSQPDAGLDRELVDQALSMIREVVGPLAQVPPEAVMRIRARFYEAMQEPRRGAAVPPLLSLGTEAGWDTEGLIQTVLELSLDGSRQDRWAAIAEALDSLHDLSDQELATPDRRTEARLPSLPTAGAIRALRREREVALKSPADWARYLKREFPLPAPLRDRLRALSTPVGPILELLELDLSTEVAEGVKGYLQLLAQPHRGEAELEAQASQLIRLATEAARGSVVPSKHRDIEFVAGLLNLLPTALLDS